MAGLTENMNHGRGGAHTSNGRGLHPRHHPQGASRPRRPRLHTFPLLPAPTPCRQTQLTLPSWPHQSTMSPPPRHLPSSGMLEPGAWRNPSANPYSPSSAKPPAHHTTDTGLPFLLLPKHPARTSGLRLFHPSRQMGPLWATAPPCPAPVSGRPLPEPGALCSPLHCGPGRAGPLSASLLGSSLRPHNYGS